MEGDTVKKGAIGRNSERGRENERMKRREIETVSGKD